jgi:hypothetical protein
MFEIVTLDRLLLLSNQFTIIPEPWGALGAFSMSLVSCRSIVAALLASATSLVIMRTSWMITTARYDAIENFCTAVPVSVTLVATASNHRGSL